MISEGVIKKLKHSPINNRRFIVNNNYSNIQNFEFLKKIKFILKILYFIVLPIVFMNVSVTVFVLLNQFQLQNLTYLLIFLSVLAISFRIITIWPAQRYFIFCKNQIKAKLNTSFEKMNFSDKAWFYVSAAALLAYTSQITENVNINSLNINAQRISEILTDSLFLSIAIFFLINSHVQLSWDLYYEFTLMVLIGIPDMLLSGLITASGLSYSTNFSVSTINKILLAIANVSLFSSIIIFNHYILKNAFSSSRLFIGNFSALNLQLASEIKVLNMFFSGNGIFTIYDYGPENHPSILPCIWYEDDIKKISMLEVQWVFNNYQNIEEIKKSVNSQYLPNTSIRGFKRINQFDSYEYDQANYFEGVNSIIVWVATPIIIFSENVDYQLFSKFVVHRKSDRSELIDIDGRSYKLPFKILWPLTMKALTGISENGCKLVHNYNKPVNPKRINFEIIDD